MRNLVILIIFAGIPAFFALSTLDSAKLQIERQQAAQLKAMDF
jgi:hypothetical protein